MAMKDTLSYVGFGLMVLTMAGAAGAEVEKDPRSTDFGKIKIGNTRYDIWAGFQPIIRLIAQLGTGEKKNAQGEIKEANRADVAGRFARTKLAPAAGTLYDFASGKDFLGNDVTVEGELVKNTVPLYIQDVASVYEQEGSASIPATAIPAFFGVGVQTYHTKTKSELKAEYTELAKKFEEANTADERKKIKYQLQYLKSLYKKAKD